MSFKQLGKNNPNIVYLMQTKYMHIFLVREEIAMYALHKTSNSFIEI